jgi:hypothetical protein
MANQHKGYGERARGTEVSPANRTVLQTSNGAKHHWDTRGDRARQPGKKGEGGHRESEGKAALRVGGKGGGVAAASCRHRSACRVCAERQVTRAERGRRNGVPMALENLRSGIKSSNRLENVKCVKQNCQCSGSPWTYRVRGQRPREEAKCTRSVGEGRRGIAGQTQSSG